MVFSNYDLNIWLFMEVVVVYSKLYVVEERDSAFGRSIC